MLKKNGHVLGQTAHYTTWAEMINYCLTFPDHHLPVFNIEGKEGGLTLSYSNGCFSIDIPYKSIKKKASEVLDYLELEYPLLQG